MTNRLELAARNNALWCNAVCRSHGLTATLDNAAWSCAARTPPLYPDAVTLRETTDGAEILRRIDGSGGASVKDCWARLDLTSAGFAPLIAGDWLWRDADAAPRAALGDDRQWRSIDSAEEMAQWSRAWAEDPEDAAILGPQLLTEPGVHVLAAQEGDDRFTAGCIVNVTGDVAGLSNLFHADGDEVRTWHGAGSAAAGVAPGLPLVGWESAEGVDDARQAGFEAIGPLTVWIR